MTYDTDNIFAKILRGEIPSDKIYEDDHVLAIKDAFPKAEIHILILPKDNYISMSDFSHKASTDEKAAMFGAVSKVVEKFDLDRNGYRVIANTGEYGGQEVPHLHWHILGGESLGPMLAKD